MRYSAKARDRIFVKNYGFLSFAKNMDKNIVINTVKNFLIILNNMQQMLLKLLQKKKLKKQLKLLMI